MFKPTPLKPVLYKFVFCAIKALKGLLSASRRKVGLLCAVQRVNFKRNILLAGIFLLTFTTLLPLLPDKVASAATPTLNFQARLENGSGAIAPDGFYNVEFKLYEGGTQSGGGALVWTETRDFNGGPDDRVRVANGYLTVNLGSVTNFPGTINWDEDLFLSMNIGGTATGAPAWDGEMTPLLKLTSVPYAFQAQSATQLEVAQGGNTGTLAFDTLTANRNILLPDEDGTVCLQGASSCGFAAASGSTNYIQNGTSLQASANFNIQAADNAANGTVAGIFRGAAGGQTVDLVQFQASNGTTLGAITAGGELQVASSVDTYSATNLSIGSSNATAITIAQAGVSTTIAGDLAVGEAATFGTTVDVTGLTTLSGGLTITSGGNVAIQRNTTDYTATGQQNNVNFGTGALFRITSASDVTITGIDGGVDGRVITLFNASSNTVTVANNDTVNSDADNVVITGTGSSITIPAGSSIQLVYDNASSVWRVVGAASTAGGYIQNQNSTDQTANFRISGTGQANTGFLAPSLDVVTAGTLSLGATTATAIDIGKAGITTTVQGALTVDELLTGGAGATVSGGAISLSGNAASSFTTSSGALTITSAVAATWSTTAGDLTLQAGSGTVSFGTSTLLTAAGSLSLTSGGANALTVDAGGAAGVNIGTINANAVTISRSGVMTTVQGALTVSEAATFNGTAQFNENVTVATGKTLQLTGGTTNSVTPTAEGQLYFDTDTNQLLVAFYNSDTSSYQWKASSQEAILVAASNSSVVDKQAADYVADGTADQTEINYALTKGAGKKVILLPGTYVASGTILVPDNTVLAGTNRNSTIVQLSVGSGTDNLIENATGFGHLNVTIQDLTLDGSLGTGGTQKGIYLYDGDASNRSSVKNVKFTSWANGSSLDLSGAYIDTVSGSVLEDISIATSQVKNFTGNQFNDLSLTSSSTIVNFANNTFNDMSMDTSSVVAFTGNDLSDMTLTNSSDITTLTGNSLTGMLTLSSGSNIVDVTGNNIGGGVTMTGSTTIGMLSANAMGRISITNSTVLTIVGNNIIYSGTDNGILLVNADSTKITANTFVRLSGSAVAISIDAASDGTFLADNAVGAGGISDSGANTIYSGQSDGNTYRIQPADDFTIAGTAASTISTTAGDLTLQGGSGTVSLGTSTSLTAAGALTITSGGASALGLDTGGGAAINIGATNATSIVIGRASGGTIRVGQNGGTVQIDGTNFDVSTTGVLTLTGGVAGGDILTQGTNALGIDTGGAAAINLGVTNANAVTIGRSGVTTEIQGNTKVTLNATTGTGLVCQNSGTGVLSVCDSSYLVPTAGNFIQNQNSSDQTGNFRISGTGQANTSILTPLIDVASAGTLQVGTGTATAITIGKSGVTTTNAGALTISQLLTGNAGATISGGAVSLTGNAASSLTTSSGALTLTSAAAATWSTTTGNLNIQAGGTSTLNLNTGGAGTVNLGATNTATVQIGGTAATTSVVLQAGSSAGNGIAVQSSSATAFRVQNSGASSTLLTADASANRRVTVGTVGTIYGTSGSNGDLVVVGNTEIQGVLYFGNSANDAIYTSSAGGPLRFKGNARNSLTVTLAPEYAGAVMTGSGVGVMTSDFCSDVLNVNDGGGTNACSTSQEHNYYSWTANASNSYSIYTKWQVPSNFDSFDTVPVQFSGWSQSANHTVVLTVLKNGTTCGSATVSNAGGWGTSSSISLAGCSISANDNLVFRATLTIGTGGVSGTDYVRMGEITINYKSQF